MPLVLETSIQEQQKYEKRRQTSAVNTVNDCVMKVWKSCKKQKYLFLITEDISFFKKPKYTYFFIVRKEVF